MISDSAMLDTYMKSLLNNLHRFFLNSEKATCLSLFLDVDLTYKMKLAKDIIIAHKTISFVHIEKY